MAKQTDEILIEHYLNNHPEDAAQIVDNLNMEDIVSLFNVLPDDLAGRLFSHMNMGLAVNCLQMIETQKAKAFNVRRIQNNTLINSRSLSISLIT